MLKAELLAKLERMINTLRTYEHNELLDIADDLAEIHDDIIDFFPDDAE